MRGDVNYSKQLLAPKLLNFVGSSSFPNNVEVVTCWLYDKNKYLSVFKNICTIVQEPELFDSSCL